MTKNRISLGDRVRDRITGFEGIAIVVADWLNGCRRIAVQPAELKDGKPIDDQYFDEQQLDVVQPGAFQQAPAASTGGDRPAPRRGADPR